MMEIEKEIEIEEKKKKAMRYYALKAPWTPTIYTFTVYGVRIETRDTSILHLMLVLGLSRGQMIRLCTKHGVTRHKSKSYKYGKVKIEDIRKMLPDLGWSAEDIETGMDMLAFAKGSEVSIGKRHVNSTGDDEEEEEGDEEEEEEKLSEAEQRCLNALRNYQGRPGLGIFQKSPDYDEFKRERIQEGIRKRERDPNDVIYKGIEEVAMDELYEEVEPEVAASIEKEQPSLKALQQTTTADALKKLCINPTK